jgi:hypothetical protein
MRSTLGPGSRGKRLGTFTVSSSCTSEGNSATCSALPSADYLLLNANYTECDSHLFDFLDL